MKYPLGCPKPSSPIVMRLFLCVEPMSSRIDLLRYFWKLSHSDNSNIVYRLLNIRKRRFLSSNHGFLHEILNLCCKYNIIDVWHGNMGSKLRPMLFIKKQYKLSTLRKIWKLEGESHVVLWMSTSKTRSSKRILTL